MGGATEEAVERARRITRVLALAAGVLFLAAAVLTWLGGQRARGLYLAALGVFVIFVLGRRRGPARSAR